MDNKDKLILYLGKNLGQGFTTHNLSKILDIPYATFYRMVKKLKKTGILTSEKVGKAEVVSLNISNDIIINYLSIASDIDRIEYLEKFSSAKKINEAIKNSNDIVLLYDDNFNNKSNILIVQNKLEKDFYSSKVKDFSEVKFITKKDFKMMISDKENSLGKHVLKNNLILNKPNEFWRVVYNVC